MTTGWPMAAPTSARPMPVLPAVPSTIVPPGRSSPDARAAVTMPSAARSLMDWPGFRNSALPRMVQPVSSDAFFSLIRGVLPIRSATEWVMGMTIIQAVRETRHIGRRRRRRDRDQAARAPMWMPHSTLSVPDQRPARASSPERTARVQGQQPMEA